MQFDYYLFPLFLSLPPLRCFFFAEWIKFLLSVYWIQFWSPNVSKCLGTLNTENKSEQLDRSPIDQESETNEQMESDIEDESKEKAHENLQTETHEINQEIKMEDSDEFNDFSIENIVQDSDEEIEPEEKAEYEKPNFTKRHKSNFF